LQFAKHFFGFMKQNSLQNWKMWIKLYK
jgi:hypothetical protein